MEERITWNIEDITIFFDNFVKKNIMVNVLLGKSGIGKEISKYIPELIYIIGINPRGMEILKILHVEEMINPKG